MRWIGGFAGRPPRRGANPWFLICFGRLRIWCFGQEEPGTRRVSFGCGFWLKAPSRGAAGERGAAGLVGARLSSVSRGQRDGDSGQSVSEVSGSARRSSAGNGGKRVPLGAGGLLETKLEWTGRVVSWSTGVYLRRAGRHCDAVRTTPVPPPCRRYCAGTYRRWLDTRCSGTSV
jgi:hypothetical protein